METVAQYYIFEIIDCKKVIRNNNYVIIIVGRLLNSILFEPE